MNQEKSPRRVTLVGGAEHLPFASEMRLNGALMKALIVPRGLSEDYYFFLRVSAEANNVELIVDRRKLGESCGARRGRFPPSAASQIAGVRCRGAGRPMASSRSTAGSLPIRDRCAKLAPFDSARERRLVPEVGIEPTRGVNPTGF